jgi:hypothetical protein
MNNVERKALEAVINHAIGLGDFYGDLGHDESWAIAKKIADELLSEKPRKTTSIPEGFVIKVELQTSDS